MQMPVCTWTFPLKIGSLEIFSKHKIVFNSPESIKNIYIDTFQKYWSCALFGLSPNKLINVHCTGWYLKTKPLKSCEYKKWHLFLGKIMQMPVCTWTLFLKIGATNHPGKGWDKNIPWKYPFVSFLCQKSPVQKSKFCNINFWIGNDPPPLGIFPKIHPFWEGYPSLSGWSRAPTVPTVLDSRKKWMVWSYFTEVQSITVLIKSNNEFIETCEVTSLKNCRKAPFCKGKLSCGVLKTRKIMPS